MIVLKRDEKEAAADVEKKGRWKKEDSVAGDAKTKDEKSKDATTMDTTTDKSGEEETVTPTSGEATSEGEKMETNDEASTTTATSYTCTGLSPDQSSALLRAAVGLISIPVEPDALNAILRLCLRLTRTFNQATLFAELGGIKLLLALTQASSFSGFSSLASLLVRHVLEDEQTLRNTMEKIIRSSAANSSPTCKELHYMLRSLAPAACREPATFTSVAKDILRVDLSLLSKRGMEPEDDGRLLLKSLPGKSSASAPALKDVSKTVIRDL